MEKLMKIVETAAIIELEDSCTKYERRFHSNHEAYGVLAEEVMEARFSIREVKKEMRELFQAIYCNSDYAVKQCAERMEKRAIEAACECIQIAAMARKEILSIDEQNRG